MSLADLTGHLQTSLPRSVRAVMACLGKVEHEACKARAGTPTSGSGTMTIGTITGGGHRPARATASACLTRTAAAAV